MEADIQFKSVSDDNMEACIRLKEEVGGVVHCLQRELAANGRAFAICDGDRVVGFTMFAFDEGCEEPNDRYWLWRFVIDRECQGRGYGHLAMGAIIAYFKNTGWITSSCPRRRATGERSRCTSDLVLRKMGRGTAKRPCFS